MWSNSLTWSKGNYGFGLTRKWRIWYVRLDGCAVGCRKEIELFDRNVHSQDCRTQATTGTASKISVIVGCCPLSGQVYAHTCSAWIGCLIRNNPVDIHRLVLDHFRSRTERCASIKCCRSLAGIDIPGRHEPGSHACGDAPDAGAERHRAPVDGAARGGLGDEVAARSHAGSLLEG